MINWRKRMKYPRAGAIWCDECLRFETGPGNFARPPKSRVSRVLYGLARAVMLPGNKVAEWLTDRAEEVQVCANIRNGVIDVVHPERERGEETGKVWS